LPSGGGLHQGAAAGRRFAQAARRGAGSRGSRRLAAAAVSAAVDKGGGTVGRRSGRAKAHVDLSSASITTALQASFPGEALSWWRMDFQVKT